MKSEKRLIDANKLIDSLKEWLSASNVIGDWDVYHTIEDCICEVNAQPTIDAVVLPCQKGAVLIHDNQKCVADHWNILLTAFNEEHNVRLFDVEEAEAALAKMDGERKDNG